MQRWHTDTRLDPFDRGFAAVVKQAIRDYERDPNEYHNADAFLLQLGLLDVAGRVRVTEDTSLSFSG